MNAVTPQLADGAGNTRARLRNAPLIERLMFRTAVAPSGCWVWAGSTNPKGYGHIRRDNGAPRLATRLENVRHGRTNQNAGKPACKNGHPFDPSNTRIDPKGKRVCRTCVREYMRARRAEEAQ